MVGLVTQRLVCPAPHDRLVLHALTVHCEAPVWLNVPGSQEAHDVPAPSAE